MHNFRKGRARDGTVHRLLRALFDLQRREGFWLRLRWIPSEAKVEADSITRPGRDEFVRLRPHVFAELWAFFGEFNIDLMASPVSAHRIPASAQWAGNRLPFFARYACDGSAGVDFFAQRCRARAGGDSACVWFLFSPYRIGQPSYPAPRRTSTRGRFTSLSSGSVGAAHGVRPEAVFYSRLSRRQKHIFCRASPAGPPAIRFFPVEYGCG